MIHYPSGTPTWVELGSPDIDASVAFYCELFGWEASEVEQSGDYRLFSSEGKIVSGIRSLQSTQFLVGWMTAISTDDTAGIVGRAEAAGGKVLLERDLSDERRLIILQDALGVAFGIFQGDLFAGAQLFNQPVSLTFNRLMTREPLVAKRFYSEVFGWDPRDRDMGSGFTFTYFFNGVRGVAGMMTMSGPGLAEHWLVSFAVENADAMVARAIELGGSVLQPPRDTPFGRGYVLSDPHGAIFSISQQTPEVRAATRTPEGVLASLR
jgi:predicted enzyme related to lactoylglutathione lyase